MPEIVYSGRPVNVTIEASWDTIREQDLDITKGEQYDRIENVISIERDNSVTTFVTTRSLEAWRRLVPHAGRGTFIIPNHALENIIIPDNTNEKE